MRTDASVDVRGAAVPGETYSVRNMDNRSGTATDYRLLIRDDQEAFFCTHSDARKYAADATALSAHFFI